MLSSVFEAVFTLKGCDIVVAVVFWSVVSFFLSGVHGIDRVLKGVGVRDVLSVLDIVDINIVVVSVVEVTLTIAACLCNSEGLLVGLVVGAGDHLLVVVSHIVCGTVGEGVLAEDDTLAENLVISGATITVVWLLAQVLEAGSVVGLVGVTVRTDTVLVVVASIRAITRLLGALVVGLGRSVLASVAVQSVSVALSIEVVVANVTLAVTTAAIFASVAVASMLSVLTAILVAAAVSVSVAVLVVLTVATVLGLLAIASIRGSLVASLAVSAIATVLTVAILTAVVGVVAGIAAVATMVAALVVLATIASLTIATVLLTIALLMRAVALLVRAIALMVVSVAMLGSVVITLVRSVEGTGELASSSNSSATHNSTMLVLGELDDLITSEVLAISSILATLASVAIDTGAIVLVGVPIAIAEVIGVAGYPSVNTLGIRLILRIPVRGFLVLTVKSDSGSRRHLLALSMVLDNLPVLLN